jgi:hypothetical protein
MRLQERFSSALAFKINVKSRLQAVYARHGCSYSQSTYPQERFASAIISDACTLPTAALPSLKAATRHAAGFWWRVA